MRKTCLLGLVIFLIPLVLAETHSDTPSKYLLFDNFTSESYSITYWARNFPASYTYSGGTLTWDAYGVLGKDAWATNHNTTYTIAINFSHLPQGANANIYHEWESNKGISIFFDNTGKLYYWDTGAHLISSSMLNTSDLVIEIDSTADDYDIYMDNALLASSCSPRTDLGDYEYDIDFLSDNPDNAYSIDAIRAFNGTWDDWPEPLAEGEAGPPAGVPLAETNLTTTYTQLGSSIPSINVLVNATYFNETTECQLSTNNTYVTGQNHTFAVGNSTFVLNLTISGLLEASIMAQVNCTGATYVFNSTAYVFSLDSNSNPSVTLNISTAYNIQDTGTFDILALGSNWYENMNCSLMFNDTGLSCSKVDLGLEDNLNYCYQEYANISTGCGGLSTGNYTYTTGGNRAYFYIDYTIPSNYNNATWQVQHGTLQKHNITLSDQCFNSNTLHLRMVSEMLTATDSQGSHVSCFNGLTFINLTENISGVSAQYTPNVGILNMLTDGNYSSGLKWVWQYGTAREVIVPYVAGAINEEGIFWFVNPEETIRCTVSGDLETSFQTYANCNGTNLYNNVNSSAYDFWIDAVSPTVSTQSFFGGNLSYYFGGNITGNFSFSDSNLWKINVTIDGNQIYTTQDINSTTYSYSLDYPVDNLSIAMHNLSVKMWDSHTKKALGKDWKMTKGLFDDQIAFKTPDNTIIITAEDTGLFNSMDYVKEKDRISFSYEPKEIKNNYKFIVYAFEPIHIIQKPHTKWGVWIISGEEWIDFYTGDDQSTVKIKLENPYTAEVVVENLKEPLKQVYHSVGELNWIDVVYSFYTYNVTIQYQPVAAVNQNQSIFLYANFSSTPPDANYSMSYNNTAYPVTRSVSGNDLILEGVYTTPSIDGVFELISGIWYLNMSVQNHTFDFNNTVYDITLDDCSFGNATVISVTIYNENTPSKNESVDMSVNFDYSFGGATFNSSFNNSGDSTYHYCLYPPEYELYVDAYFLYSAATGFTHRYYLINRRITNSTLSINMFNYNDTAGISNLKGTVRDEDTYQYSIGTYASLQRYYVGQNVWRTVQMDKTGDFGLIFFNIREEDTDYRLRFYDDNANLLKTTNRLKFVCTSNVCDLTFLVPNITSLSANNEFVANASYNNITKIISVWWDDPSGLTSTVQAVVSKDTMSSRVIICDQTLSGATGNITCNTTGYSGNLRVTVTAEHSPATLEFVKTFLAATTRIGNIIGDAPETSMWSFIMYVTILMMGIASPVAAILSALVALVTLLLMGLLTGMQITFVVLAALIGALISWKVKR